MKHHKFLHQWRSLSFTFALLLSAHACALDNPDSKNFVAQFEENSRPYKQAIDNPGNGSRDYLIAYDNYLQFLDGELNKVYLRLKAHLSAERQKELAASQQNWLKFRDSEFLLIENNWTRDSFGSSSGISRGAFRCTLIEHRIRELLSYDASY